METSFKVLFSFAVFLFCFVIIGLFLLAIKIILLFTDHVSVMGVLMTGS